MTEKESGTSVKNEGRIDAANSYDVGREPKIPFLSPIIDTSHLGYSKLQVFESEIYQTMKDNIIETFQGFTVEQKEGVVRLVNSPFRIILRPRMQANTTYVLRVSLLVDDTDMNVEEYESIQNTLETTLKSILSDTRFTRV